MSTQNPFLVDTDWLLARLDNPDVSIVDASWYLPNMNRDGRAEFDAQHIPGAVFFDIDKIVDPASTLPHALAPADIFAKAVGELGISDQNTIVVYDGMGLFSAARAWWNFRVMGATKVVLLDGGLPKWIEDRLPIESGSAPIAPRKFEAKFNPNAVADLAKMQSVVQSRTMQVADARPAPRFSGEQPEPRPGVRSGHMPGAHSLPFDKLVVDGKLLEADQLREAFQAQGIDLSKPIATSCGSGVTASIITLALETLGHSNHVLYDGSWAEWGTQKDTPVVTGD